MRQQPWSGPEEVAERRPHGFLAVEAKGKHAATQAGWIDKIGTNLQGHDLLYPAGSGHLSSQVSLEDSGVRGNRWERRKPRAMALT
jgi:hypothetical protein